MDTEETVSWFIGSSCQFMNTLREDYKNVIIYL